MAEALKVGSKPVLEVVDVFEAKVRGFYCMLSLGEQE